MDTKPKIKQIQLLGSTFVSGYFAFAELVNYKQFNQRKIIKRFEKGGYVQYGKPYDKYLNVIKQDDTIGNIFIPYILVSQNIKIGEFIARYSSVIPVPYDYNADLYLIDGRVRVYESTNKSFSRYIVMEKGSVIWVGADLVAFSICVNDTNRNSYSVAYIDMCINTTEPITFNYVGEAEFIQNSTIDNDFTPLFRINSYDYNCF